MKLKKRNLIRKRFFSSGFFMFVFVFLSCGTALAQVIPSDRIIDWSQIGVVGGIPDRQIIYTSLKPGATAAQINAAITDCPANQVVYLNAGNYNLTATISLKSDMTLRGAGPDSTVLIFIADLERNLSIYGGRTDGTNGGIDIVSGHTKGSSQLMLSNASDFVPNNYVYISELNDPSLPVVVSNTNGKCGWCGIYGTNGTRARLQLSKVTSVSGNTITISPPMFYTFSGANAPQALKVEATYVKYAGIENLTVKNAGTTLTTSRKGIEIQGAANCWVRNVKIEKGGKRGIDIWFDVFHNEIRECLFSGVIDQKSSDNYALQIENGTGNLIENNIFSNTANGILTVSAAGNVFGYNYMHGVHRTNVSSTWFWPDTWTHGGHSSFNLWEGNDETALEWDYYWGSNSHNLAFRNRFHGRDTTLSYDLAKLQTVGTILNYPDNNYMSELGNVLGTSGFHNKYEETEYRTVSRPIWVTVRSAFGTTTDKGFNTMLRHMNYDYYTNSVKHCGDEGEPGCQGGDGSTILPASLYLLQKPAWFGNVPWPPIGPDVVGYTNKIPAQLRFDAINVRLVD